MNELEEISLVDEKLIGLNNTKVEYSYNKTVYELFEETVTRYPNNVAVYLEDKVITYHGLNSRANQMARYLRKQGVQPNTIIGIEMERSLEMIIGIFAILKSGGAYLPIDPHYPAIRKQQIFTDSQTQFLIVKNHPTQNNCQFDGNIIDICNILLQQEDPANLVKINLPHDMAYVIYTSGSTGKPKGVMIKHHSLVNRIEWMQQRFPIATQDVLFQKTNYTFDVSVWEILWWSIDGAAVCLLMPNKEHDVRLFTKMIEKNSISVIHFVPSVLRLFLDYIEVDFDLKKLRSLKYVFASGEELDPYTVRRFNQVFNTGSFPILINLYGPTEATIDVSYFICSKDKEHQQVPIGKPINNTQFFILGKNLQFLPMGVEGDLYISGVGLAAGYLNNPELTKNVFIPNPYLLGELMYKTGDIAKWDFNGQLLFLGRIDDQVKLRGLRVELGEIQYHLMQHEEVRDAIVLCVANQLEQILVAFVILKNKEIKRVDFSAYLSEKLPCYMIPTSFIFLDVLPLKSNGKIDKQYLKSYWQQLNRI